MAAGTQDPAERLILALDVPDRRSAMKLLDWVPEVKFVKVGSVLFGAEGPKILREISKRDVKIFLDLKLHDIPNTVAGAIKNLTEHAPIDLLTIHAAGGKAMIEAAQESVAALPTGSRPKVIAVTVLTSLVRADLEAQGISTRTVEEQVIQLAKLAVDSGADGVVCSPQEIEAVRKVLPPSAIAVVPGIRPTSQAGKDDQQRTATAREALNRGATYLVVGRPITEASNPREAFEALCEEMAGS